LKESIREYTQAGTIFRKLGITNMPLTSIFQMIISAISKPKQHIMIKELPEGRMIDIGGGGEGVIGQADGARVVAIDKLLSEINEAKGKAPEVSWLVADAIQMPFDNQSFDHATAFFCCMYMTEEGKAKVFKETRRVLKMGSEFWIWDANISSRSKAFAIRITANLQGTHQVNTTYGVKTKVQSMTSILHQLREARFDPHVITNHKHWFFIKAS
jgi:ubiquinone/menaquinone biosynthesis C-methylase UbiE